MINENLLNYTSPVISVSKDGFVTGKNHCFDSIFKVVHVGALASKYTEIDFQKEQMSTDSFCGVKCAYCTIFDENETLLFLFPEAIGEASLMQKVLDCYKKRLNEVRSGTSETKKTVEKKYIKSVNDKIIKANYFNVFRDIYEKRLHTAYNDDDSVLLSRVCTAVMNLTANTFENVSVNFDIDYLCGNLIANTTENNMLCIILNSIAFCIINTNGNISVELTEDDSIARLSYKFQSNIAFDSILNPSNDSLLNSSISLMFATEIAKTLGYEYTIFKKSIDKKTSEYTLLYKIPVKVKDGVILSSSDTVTPIAKRLLSLIFFDSLG